MIAIGSGALVHKIGGATFLSVGKLGEAILTLASPYVMRIHLYLFLVLRLALGIFEVILATRLYICMG